MAEAAIAAGGEAMCIMRWRTGAVVLPALSRAVSAGFPSPADDHIEEDIDLQRLLVSNRVATFFVRVAGTSMVEAQLFDGDIAIVDRSAVPAAGDIVVVDVDGDRSFKVWTGRRSAPLAFANPTMTAYELPPSATVEVWGVVTGSVNPRRRAHRA
jgi:DNA polymerase V